MCHNMDRPQTQRSGRDPVSRDHPQQADQQTDSGPWVLGATGLLLGVTECSGTREG